MSEFYEGNDFNTLQAENAAKEQKVKLANEVLTWGILGLAFAFQFCFLGIPFSRKGLRLADNFINMYGETDARVKVGRILAKVGSIVSLVFTLLSIGYILFYIFYIVVFLGLMMM